MMPKERPAESADDYLSGVRDARISALEGSLERHEQECATRYSALWKTLNANSRVLYVGVGILVVLQVIALSGFFKPVA